MKCGALWNEKERNIHMKKSRDELENIEDFDDVVDNSKYISPIIKRKVMKWIVVILVSALIGGTCGWKIHAYFTKEDSMPVDYITAKLEDASELTTQTITYTSRVPMSDGSIPFITKKSFVMYYNATLRAGVDLSDVKVRERGNDKIIVTLPHAIVQGTPNIDPNTIEFVDEKRALLNWNKKEDIAEALVKAKEDLESNPSIDMTLLLQKADEHAEELVHMLLDDAYANCEIIVQFKN